MAFLRIFMDWQRHQSHQNLIRLHLRSSTHKTMFFPLTCHSWLYFMLFIENAKLVLAYIYLKIACLQLQMDKPAAPMSLRKIYCYLAITWTTKELLMNMIFQSFGYFWDCIMTRWVVLNIQLEAPRKYIGSCMFRPLLCIHRINGKTSQISYNWKTY